MEKNWRTPSVGEVWERPGPRMIGVTGKTGNNLLNLTVILPSLACIATLLMAGTTSGRESLIYSLISLSMRVRAMSPDQ